MTRTVTPQRSPHVLFGHVLLDHDPAAASYLSQRLPPDEPGAHRRAQSRAAHSPLRHQWQTTSKTAQAIEVTVAELLSSPAQAELAARQMRRA